MNKESAIERISRKTGRKPIACKCSICKKQCTTAPCLGTPSDIEKIIDAGYGQNIFPTTWMVGMMMGVVDYPIQMYQAEFVDNQACVFLLMDCASFMTEA